MTPLECLKMLLNDGWLNVGNAEFAIYDTKTMKTVDDVARETIAEAEKQIDPPASAERVKERTNE